MRVWWSGDVGVYLANTKLLLLEFEYMQGTETLRASWSVQVDSCVEVRTPLWISVLEKHARQYAPSALTRVNEHNYCVAKPLGALPSDHTSGNQLSIHLLTKFLCFLCSFGGVPTYVSDARGQKSPVCGSPHKCEELLTQNTSCVSWDDRH